MVREGEGQGEGQGKRKRMREEGRRKWERREGEVSVQKGQRKKSVRSVCARDMGRARGTCTCKLYT